MFLFPVAIEGLPIFIRIDLPLLNIKRFDLKYKAKRQRRAKVDFPWSRQA